MIVHPGGNFPFFIQTIFCFDDADERTDGRGTKIIGLRLKFLKQPSFAGGRGQNAARLRVDFPRLVGFSNLNVCNRYHGRHWQTTADAGHAARRSCVQRPYGTEEKAAKKKSVIQLYPE